MELKNSISATDIKVILPELIIFNNKLLPLENGSDLIAQVDDFVFINIYISFL